MSIFSNRVCARRVTETGCSSCGELGIIEGTAVGVRGGWRRVESLNMFDHLAVLSGSHRQTAEIVNEQIWMDPFDCPVVARPLLVPLGALGNDSCFRLQQDMRVIFASKTLASVFEATHVSVRAGDLLGFRKIALEAIPPKEIRIFRIFFDNIDAIAVAGGIWLLCPQRHTTMNGLVDGIWDRCEIGGQSVRHLTADEATVFLAAPQAIGTGGPRHV